MRRLLQHVCPRRPFKGAADYLHPFHLAGKAAEVVVAHLRAFGTHEEVAEGVLFDERGDVGRLGLADEMIRVGVVLGVYAALVSLVLLWLKRHFDIAHLGPEGDAVEVGEVRRGEAVFEVKVNEDELVVFEVEAGLVHAFELFIRKLSDALRVVVNPHTLIQGVGARGLLPVLRGRAEGLDCVVGRALVDDESAPAVG